MEGGMEEWMKGIMEEPRVEWKNGRRNEGPDGVAK